MSHFPKNSNSQCGFSLISVMVAVAIGGIVAASIATMIGNGMKGEQSLSLKMDRLIVAQTLFTSVSCSNTLPGTCTPGALQTLRRVSKTGVVSTMVTNTGAGTRFGQLAVRAECNATGDGLIVRAAYLNPKASITTSNLADFRPDPLTGKKYTWADDQTKLYPDGIELCDGSGSGTGPNLSDCVNVNVPWVGTNSGAISSISCPANRPYFSGLIISQETLGKKSDYMSQIRCCS
jgi:hypothetical protein